MMDEVLAIVEQALKLEPLHNNCHIKIRRGEIAPPVAFIKGKEEGARLLAEKLAEALRDAGYII